MVATQQSEVLFCCPRRAGLSMPSTLTRQPLANTDDRTSSSSRACALSFMLVSAALVGVLGILIDGSDVSIALLSLSLLCCCHYICAHR